MVDNPVENLISTVNRPEPEMNRPNPSTERRQLAGRQMWLKRPLPAIRHQPVPVPILSAVPRIMATYINCLVTRLALRRRRLAITVIAGQSAVLDEVTIIRLLPNPWLERGVIPVLRPRHLPSVRATCCRRVVTRHVTAGARVERKRRKRPARRMPM